MNKLYMNKDCMLEMIWVRSTLFKLSKGTWLLLFLIYCTDNSSFSTLGDNLNSLLTVTSFSWYSAGGRKRDLCHWSKQTMMKLPSTLVHGALHKTHAPCIVYWPFLESLFLPPGQVPGKKGPLLARNNLNTN